MTIYWRGKGILAIIIPFVLIFIPSIIGKDNQLIASIMAILGGIIVFAIGKKWNSNENNFEIESMESNSKFKIPKHSLFWVAMEYWGVLFLLFGLTNMINEFLGLNFGDLFYGICLFGMLTLIFVYRRREKKFIKEMNVDSNQIIEDQKTRKPVENRLTTKSNTRLEKNLNSNKNNSKNVKEINEKKKLFEELRNIRNEQKYFEPSNHEDFMPKKELDRDET